MTTVSFLKPSFVLKSCKTFTVVCFLTPILANIHACNYVGRTSPSERNQGRTNPITNWFWGKQAENQRPCLVARCIWFRPVRSQQAELPYISVKNDISTLRVLNYVEHEANPERVLLCFLSLISFALFRSVKILIYPSKLFKSQNRSI